MMTSTVGLRPNLYEVLGLRPSASQADIEQAFRRELNPFMPHAIGGVAAASVAYATLRDPAKRQAYDEANGLNRPPAPVAAPRAVGGGWSMGNANVMRATPRPMHDLPVAAPRAVAPEAAPEAAAPIAAAPIAAKPVPLLHSKPPAETPRPAQVILGMDEAEDAVIDGKKGAIVLGAIGAVALAGGMFGWLAGSDAGETPANAAVVSSLPKAGSRDLAIITPAADVVAEPSPPERAAARPVVRQRAAPKPVAVASLELPAEMPVTEEPAVADALAPQPASAAMPLPARTVARTIDRIGYSCGSVTATESAGGGVYNVTCSSGQRFRASPRNGRYRFKRV
jgi:hypothetical protein